MADIPYVDSARDRLGSLLKSIRNQTGAALNGKRSSSHDDEESDVQSDHDEPTSPYRAGAISGHRRSSLKLGKFSPSKGGPGSASSIDKKKRRSQKKIIFELRQKAFEIQNAGVEHGLYALCRIWMRGRQTPGTVVTGQPIDRSTVDYDQESLLAARSISRKSTVLPEANRDDSTTVTGNEESASEILGQYLPRWQRVKKDFCLQRSKTDAAKYGDSLRVLREMYATAQNHVIGM